MVDHRGEQFGEYRLIRKLGGGTFGDVYLGEHNRDNTPAAIKVLLARLTHPEDLKAFINEIRTLFRLQHPNIVPLLDFGIERDSPFLIMAYAPKGTLRQPRGTRLPLETVAIYIRQVAEALQCAHDRKLIHRDIKPDNILLGENEHVWLSDFGITTIAQSSRSLNTQDSAGTVHYMAPEQIQGKPRPASDQYALGIIAYEWICGERPFNCTYMEVAIQHAQAAPPAMSEKVPTLSPAVEQVVRRALEKDYAKRYGSVREFAEALVVAVEEAEPTIRHVDGQKLEKTVAVEAEPVGHMDKMDVEVEPTRYTPQNESEYESEHWLEVGDAHQEVGNSREAIAAYNRAITLDPSNARAYHSRGDAYADLGKYKRAISDYTRAIELDPRNSEVYDDRGLAYYALKDYDWAISNYTWAIELDPHNATAYAGED